VKRFLIWGICLIGLLFFWEQSAARSADVRFFVSSPSASIRYASEHIESLRAATLITSLETVSGFALAVIVGGIFVLVSLFLPAFLKAVLPFSVATQIIPLITLAPLFVVLFGLGLVSKIAMVALMCFFPIFVNFIAGAQSVPPQVRELAYVYNAKPVFRVFKLVLPLSLPQGFAGLKVSTTMAVMGAIVAEFTGAYDGLGKNLYLAPKSSQPELMVCSVLLVGLLGFLFYGIVALIERATCRWAYHTAR